MIRQWLQQKWDWQVYRWSHKSFKRMAKDRPGIMLVVELTLHEYNKDLDEDVRRAATMFHDCMTAKVNPDPPKRGLVARFLDWLLSEEEGKVK